MNAQLKTEIDLALDLLFAARVIKPKADLYLSVHGNGLAYIHITDGTTSFAGASVDDVRRQFAEFKANSAASKLSMNEL